MPVNLLFLFLARDGPFLNSRKKEWMRDNINLLEETIEILQNCKHSTEDVLWVGVDGEWSCSWQQFEKVVANLVYNNGYGISEINDDLKVVGKDFWLERHEYDGSEWWEYKEQPVMPQPISTLDIGMVYKSGFRGRQ